MKNSAWFTFAIAPLIVMSTLLPIETAVAASAKTKSGGVTCATLYQDLFAHSAAAMKSQEKSTTFFYWGRARVAIEATPAEKLEEIFSKMSKADLENLYWSVKSGATKATREEDKMIEELWHMVDDLGEKPFWGPAPDRAFAIQQALRAHDAKLTYSGDPAFAAQLTDKALSKTEGEMILRALSEHESNAKYANSKWSDRIVRFFSPHHDKVVDLLEANNSIRRRLQKMYTADKPVLEGLPKFQAELDLTNDELKALQAQASDTAGQLNEARKDIEQLYGREVSVTAPLPAADIRLRDLVKRIGATGTRADESALTRVTEENMDTIDEVVGGAWNRKHKTKDGLPLTEKHDVHLQIRNPQYRRETPVLRAAYQNITETRVPKEAAYTVETQWDVTVYHKEMRTRKESRPIKDAQGNPTGQTEQVDVEYEHKWTTSYTPPTRTDTLQARYEEVLVNQINPEARIDELPALPTARTDGSSTAYDASNGPPRIESYDSRTIAKILDQGKNARASEKPYRAQIARATELIDQVTNGSYKDAIKKPGETQKLLSSFRAEEAALRTAREELVAYQAQDAKRIQGQWAQDKEKDFKDRNKQMVDRYDHMIKRISHAAEQVRRESPSLEIEYSLPDYQPQLTRLREIRDQNRRIIRNTAIGTAATGAGTAGFVYREEVMGFVRDLTGQDDGQRRRDRNGY